MTTPHSRRTVIAWPSLPSRLLVVLAAILSIAALGTSACTNNESTAKDRSEDSSKKENTGATKTTNEVDPAQDGIDVMPVPVVGPANAPVQMDQPGDFGNGVTVRITGTQVIDVKAKLPGETTGTAIAVSLELANNSKKSIELSNVIVDLTDSEGGSFNLSDSAEQNIAFKGELKAGGTASATYVFRAEIQKGSSQYLTVKYATAVPTVVFAGRITND